jgi:adenine-specific DNA-methyltransferase
MTDYTKLSLQELRGLCKERKLKGYSTKKKAELVSILSAEQQTPITEEKKFQRLNYIGSKFQLLDWITTTIREKTGWQTFEDRVIADLFGGTGIVSHHFRTLGATVKSNDAELFSSIITRAFTKSIYNETCKRLIQDLNNELETGRRVGFVTEKYTPHNTNERMFFTEENGQKIDYLRTRIEELKASLSPEDYTFIIASLLVSADAVSNVPAVYGCYLKNFKDKATKPLKLIPLHTTVNPAKPESETFHLDVLSDELIQRVSCDAVYLDPPYNERQYSKNYFPLNIIAKTPTELLTEPALKGKTGIPTDCFISPFCKKGKTVEEAFERLFSKLNTKWIFLSYNSESLVTKDRLIELMKKYGEVSVVERDYKRFKSFEYNNDNQIKEYLFCLSKAQ